MDNITEFEVTDTLTGETSIYVTITNGSGFTTMTKAYWDEQQAQKELGETL